ncbi:MAG TPA: SMR family transporter, partial [Magnetospirillum sp.]|nr:SMR family transporter [Magnetospirillum sp.]
MAWFYLIIAGLLEIAWAAGLKAGEGLTRPWVAAATLAAMLGSIVLLGLAMRSLPISTAYAAWTGIGILGSALIGL